MEITLSHVMIIIKNELILWQLDLFLGKIHLQVTTDFPFPRKQNPAYNEYRFKLR